MTTTTLTKPGESRMSDVDELLAEATPLLSVVPVAGPPAFVLAAFGAVLLLLLVPPLALVVTLIPQDFYNTAIFARCGRGMFSRKGAVR